MNTEFQAAYRQLNNEQRQAVEAIDGPVLVVAGPGTGKTQLLSMRVANILKKTDAQPSNVLCLTFTNKAAVNMKERIIQLAGPGGARVPVKTFHSLAAEIMNIYPDYFWNAASVSIAPDSVQLDIIESIVRELPLDNPLALKFSGQYTLLGDIQRAIGLAKEAGLTPAKLRAIIEVNLAYIDVIENPLVDILGQRLSAKSLDKLAADINQLPKQTIDAAVYPLKSLSNAITESLDLAIEQDQSSGKTTHTSAWKRRWVQTVDGQKSLFNERQRNNWWLELAGIYEAYRDQLHQRGFYDYADMLVEVIAQLEQQPAMLADVQERFSHILIDEYQDTNPAQMRLAHLVADHFSANGRPNLMAVGDDDQSIYKFNGAELNNMLDFKRHYKNTKVVVLTGNYRSTQAVLDTAKRVIEQASVRLVSHNKSLDKQLMAAAPPAGKGVIKAVAYASRELQLSSIARDIAATYKPSKSTAVLARNHDSLIKMSGLLQGLDVPVRYEQQSNVLEHDIVNQVYLLVQLLVAIQDGDHDKTNALVHQVIRHPMWDVAPTMLWQLAVDNYHDGDWLVALLSSQSAELRAIGDWLVWLAAQATNQPLAVTLEYLIGLRRSKHYPSPLKDYFLNGNQELANQYFRSLSAIQLLRALVHDFARDNDPSLAELVRFIEVNKTNGRVIADESPFITGQDAVQLLTVHKAKGLEFDHVYVIDAIDDNWQPGKGARHTPANLPLQPVGDDFDDYVRLMYVAVTRAKSSITISSYYQDHAGRDVAASVITQSALSIEKIDENNQTKLVEILEENLRWPQLLGGQEQAILKARLETYNLSVTHLLNFLNLEKGGPTYFKEHNLLRLPEAKTPHLAYGTAMHAALEAAQKLTNKGAFKLTAVQAVFDEVLLAQQLATTEYKRFSAQGKRTLGRLFTDYKYALPKGSRPEQDLKDIHLDQAIIRSKLDRIDVDGQSLRIIDYKTGQPLSSFETTAKALAHKAHNYKLQLTFYAILASQHPSYGAYSDVAGQMVYVEADSAKNLVRQFVPPPTDIERLRQLIEAVWLKITTLELPDVAGYSKDIDGSLQFEQDLIDGKI